ncbi:sulfatase-like hydrolase/transferase [Bordetella hinzii]|uniref:Phosphatase n=1 Tax=Bordetella hinzii TaxID=103855 RepID=A0AAN1VF57_9BORD|nr:sulfatase-like hydrolase/transferase [Bordetella hinzii]AKQ58425.1 Sulfatase [Bordetella hinzii]AZW16255.1 phosphatase [Bordetella hinzii]QET45193.1 sulfatase-like hydrolase/transferase [Bordetella hinzii]
MDAFPEDDGNTDPSAEPDSAERRRFILATGLAAAGVMSGASVTAAQASGPAGVRSVPARPPSGYNILLIVTDQERHFAGGYPFPVPGRERLMREGVTFLHHESNTNVCTSSRSVMYTGLHMPQTGMFDNLGLPFTQGLSLDPRLGTLGTMMSEAGYYAAYKGKWHLNDKVDAVAHPEDLGLQPSEELHAIMEQYGFKDYHGIGDVIGLAQGGYMYDSVTTGQSINWLRSTGQQLRDAAKPWFLAVNLVNPHDVMFIDTDLAGQRRQWRGKLTDGGVGMAPAQPPEHAIYRATWPDIPLPASRHQSFTAPGRPAAHLEYQRARAALVGQFPDEDRRWRKLQDYYFNCIRDCDTHVVRILDELDALGIADSTIVVFTADHGELGGHHQMHGKGSSVYREQMHVPMVIRHPAYPAGVSCSAMTCHLDLAPTLIGLTGLPAAQRARILGSRKGKDFSSLLASPRQAAPRAVRHASLYCYSMFLYADADYLRRIQDIKRRTDLSEKEKAMMTGRLKPDLRKRSGIRAINDGRHKFARYFSLLQHNTPGTFEALTALNDLELFDLQADPGEMRNLAVDPEAHREILMAMSGKLNDLIAEEVGVDDGHYLPIGASVPWDTQRAIE